MRLISTINETLQRNSIQFKREKPLSFNTKVGVLQVALVTLGRHIGLLNNWYCQPEETEVSDTFYLLNWHFLSLLLFLSFKMANSVHFPDSHRLRPFSFVNIPDWYYIYLHIYSIPECRMIPEEKAKI